MMLCRGGLAEWFKATVLKTVGPQGSAGSNPVSSAIKPPLKGQLWPLFKTVILDVASATPPVPVLKIDSNLTLYRRFDEVGP